MPAIGDAESCLALLQSSSGAMNYSKCKNEHYDTLMARAANTLDLRARSSLLAEAEEIILDEQSLIPQYFTAYRTLVKPYVTGRVDNPSNVHRTRYLDIDRSAESYETPVAKLNH